MQTIGASKHLDKQMQLNWSPIDLYKSMKKVRQKATSQTEKQKKVEHGQFLKDSSNKEANKFLLEQEKQGAKKEKSKKGQRLFSVLT